MENNSNSKKKKAALIIQKNLKKLLYPYINRVSANIYNRINYYHNINKNLNINNSKNNYCIRFYKFDKNNNPIFRIGDNIILKQKIGTDSAYGIIYLCSFRSNDKKLYKFSVKIALNTYDLQNEIKINKILTSAALKDKCPHFPLMYEAINCDNFLNFDNSNFKYSHSNDISKNKDLITDIKNYPLLLKKNRGYPLSSILSELANGDLKKFITINNKNNKFIENSLAQIFISLLFFYQETGFFHNDAHWGNFLYHKIKKGGYFHYIINGNNYYIENIGYLWIIWDFGLAKLINSFNFNIRTDFLRIINAYNDRIITTNLNIDGLNTELSDKIYKLKCAIDVNEFYSPKIFNNYINTILYFLVDLKFIKTSILKNEFIINKKPYIFKK